MKRLGWLAAAAIGLALVLPGCSPGEKPSPTKCGSPAGSTIQDVDPEDSPVKPWEKTAGTELTVYFETAALSGRYAELVAQGAEIWSAGPCVRTLAVQRCPADANCINITEDSGGERGTDAEYNWQGQDAYMEGGTITLYERALERTNDNGTLATIVHEMGHALGLVHRLDQNDVMNATTGDDTNPTPDSVDFANLAIIYGSGP